MEQIHVIRHKILVEGMSVRKVAQQMGFSRNTIRRAALRLELPHAAAELLDRDVDGLRDVAGHKLLGRTHVNKTPAGFDKPARI